MVPKWHALPRREINDQYNILVEANNGAALRQLILHDLFFLLTRACKRVDADNDWCYARCREVEADPDGYLDLWARFHYKSSIITFAKTIQDVIANSEERVCIFSYNRPRAKDFLRQIKEEVERNVYLKRLFPEVFYEEPERQSPMWSLDGGLIFRRQGNPKEPTIMASGLVDSQPTGCHFSICVYDDVVVQESVSTPDQITKTTDAWSLSLALGTPNTGRERYLGTPYHLRSTYHEIVERGLVKLRQYPCTVDGTPDGTPVFLSPEELAKWRKKLGPYDFSSQMLVNPLADEAQGFKEDWIQYYDGKLDHRMMNVYLLVDPASAKKKNSDYTAMQVWGASADENYYLLDAIYDRLNLDERTDRLFHFHRLYHPLKVGYEQYGMQADVAHIKYVQREQQYRFAIVELGGNVPKSDRIRAMIPSWSGGRRWLPRRLLKRSVQGKTYDVVQILVQDGLLCFPVGAKDDDIDCAARLEDPALGVTFPLATAGRQVYSDGSMSLPSREPVVANNKYEVLP